MYQRKQSRRGPREKEIEFLRELARSPQTITEGPLGLCLKRGWCSLIPADSNCSSGMTRPILVAITPEGMEALKQAGKPV